MRNLYVSALICSLSVVATATAQVRSLPEEIAKLRRSAPNVRVHLDGDEVRQLHSVPMSHGRSVGESVEKFLNEHLSLFGVAREMLRSADGAKLMNGKFTLVAYRQEVNGIPVHDRWIKLLVRNDADHPLVLVNSSLRKIEEPPTRAEITPAVAVDIVRRAEPKLARTSVAELVYWPDTLGRVRLAWRFFGDIGAARDFDQREFFVDAASGELLDQQPAILDVGVTGNVQGFQAPPPMADLEGNPQALLPVRGARIRSSTGLIVHTDADGNYSFDIGQATDVTVELDLNGKWSNIQNAGFGGDLLLSRDISPTTPGLFTLNIFREEHLAAQLSAITGVSRAHDFIKSSIAFAPGIDTSVPTVVNFDQHCNAFYSIQDETLTFLREGEGCPNSAYGSVIYHEYGHFVIDTAPGGPETLWYHEGMADVVASLLAHDPCIAPDLRGLDTGCIRNVETTEVRFPCFGGGHLCGQIVGGAFWEMRTNLMNTLGDQVGLDHARSLAVGQIFTGIHIVGTAMTIDVLTLDDDDGDLSNGTPNYHAINSAFTERGLPGPAVLFNDGDFNDDGDLDLDDYAEFFACTSGPGVELEEGCEPADFDGDLDVDLRDFRFFSRRHTGACGVFVAADPQDIVACQGDTAVFSLSGSGDSDIEFRWTLNDTLVVGAEQPVLSVYVDNSTLGQYRGYIVSSCAIRGSDEATLAYAPPPIVLDLPDDIETCIDESVTLSVSAAGFENLQYQWQLDGDDIPGADAADYEIEAVKLEDVGQYTCVVSDRCGQSVSTLEQPVELTLIPPDFIAHPQPQNVCLGQPAAFEVEPSGREPFEYRWLHNGIFIEDATERVYAIESVGEEHLGQYRCLVGDACGAERLSFSTQLRHGFAVINTQPARATICTGETVFVFVSVSGGSSFQWLKDGQPIPNATSGFFAVTGAAPANSGVYQVRITALCNEVLSEAAVVTVEDCP